MHALLVDTGILLDEKDEEFEAYSTVYDKKHGYYDECQNYARYENLEVEKGNVREYVSNGVENTYGVISLTSVPENLDFEDDPVEGENYLVQNILFSVAKVNGKLVEGFIAV